MIRLYPLTLRQLGGGEPQTQIIEKMKTKQTKIDLSAAKWLPGAMALAATTASSQAATVQITLTGNKISSTGGNQLVADLTGDNVADLIFFDPTYGSEKVSVLVDGYAINAYVVVGPGWFFADARFANGGVGVGNGYGGTLRNLTYLNPILFTDTRINGGVATEAWVEVNAYNTSSTNHTVALSRLIFDDANATRPAFASVPGVQTEYVPEPSSLALLALGAGGLMMRRRRAA